MSQSDYLPEKMGKVTLSPTGRFVAGEFASFTLTYTAGYFGIDDTGSLKIVTRFATDMGRPQFTDPKAPNYVSVEASNNALLEVRYDVKGHVRPWFKTIRIDVLRGFLREGDTITVRLGDTRQGSPGLRLQTFCEDSFEFRVLVDAFATYRFVELPEQPSISIVAGPPAAWKAALPTVRRVGEPFRLSLKAEDRWGNPSDRVDQVVRPRPSRPVAGLPAEIRFSPGETQRVVDGLTIAEPGDLTISIADDAGQALTTSNPLRIVERADLLPYWADLHAQSEETIGTNYARDYFEFGRDRAFLDVLGHQGNDFQITKPFYAELNRLMGVYHDPGRFVTLPGYEWSGNTGLGGDRNVFFARETELIHRSSHVLVDDRSDGNTDCHSAKDLFAALSLQDAVVTAHVGGRYADVKLAHDGRVERSVEIHSAWGTFEWLLLDGLEKGYRIGIVCNSDDHKGRPGASYPGASLFGAYGGLTCLLMPALTRPAVIDCLRRRHHYGTTGTRMILDVQARFDSPAELFDEDPALGPTASRATHSAMMGDILRVKDDSATICVDIHGAAPIERVELRCGAEVLETIRPYAESELGRRIRVIWEGAEYRGRGRQTDWDGTARLTGNRFRETTPINFWNPDRALERKRGGLAWKSLTTGNFAGFEARLDHARDGRLTVTTPLVSCDLAIAEIGHEDRVFEAGGLGRRLRLFRLPDRNPHATLRFERRVRLREHGDTPIYVRVTQEDGHLAWSSPIYLFR